MSFLIQTRVRNLNESNYGHANCRYNRRRSLGFAILELISFNKSVHVLNARCLAGPCEEPPSNAEDMKKPN